MQMYPAYKAQDVLDEYAVRFYALLNEGYRLRYEAASLKARMLLIPHMEESDRNNFLRQLEYAAKHPDDILDTGDDGSSPAEIKKLLGG